jgi:hypothetical protein
MSYERKRELPNLSRRGCNRRHLRRMRQKCAKVLGGNKEAEKTETDEKKFHLKYAKKYAL